VKGVSALAQSEQLKGLKWLSLTGSGELDGEALAVLAEGRLALERLYLSGSCSSRASRMASEIWSATLSGCPLDTDSEVKRDRGMDGVVRWVSADSRNGCGAGKALPGSQPDSRPLIGER
jgi:hypothetical protein